MSIKFTSLITVTPLKHQLLVENINSSQRGTGDPEMPTDH